MQLAQKDACAKIMERLYRRPISRLFWDYETYLSDVKSPKPLSFKIVGERLQNGYYKSAYDWVYDMRIVMSSVLRGTSVSDARNAAARQLAMDFEREMSVLSPTLAPHTLDLQFVEWELADWLVRSTPPVGVVHEVTDAPPAAEQFKKDDEEGVDIQRLSDDIRTLCTPAMLLRILAFVHHCQPEALSVGKQMGIVFSIMKESTLHRLREFVSGMMFDAAIGKINPSPRPPGSYSFKPIVTE